MTSRALFAQLGAAVIIGALGTPASAQQVLRGTISDDSTRRAIVGAEVTFDSAGTARHQRSGRPLPDQCPGRRHVDHGPRRRIPSVDGADRSWRERHHDRRFPAHGSGRPSARRHYLHRTARHAERADDGVRASAPNRDRCVPHSSTACAERGALALRFAPGPPGHASDTATLVVRRRIRGGNPSHRVRRAETALHL